MGASKVDLELQLDERQARELAGRLIYDRELSERATAARLRGHRLRLTELVAFTDPLAPINTLSMFAPAEERRQLNEWNTTRTARPGRLSPTRPCARTVVGHTDPRSAVEHTGSIGSDQRRR